MFRWRVAFGTRRLFFKGCREGHYFMTSVAKHAASLTSDPTTATRHIDNENQTLLHRIPPNPGSAHLQVMYVPCKPASSYHGRRIALSFDRNVNDPDREASTTITPLSSLPVLPLGTPQEDTDIQKVWATFLDLLQSETRWTPFRSQLHPDWDTDHLDRQKSPPPQSPPLPLGSATDGARTGSGPGSGSGDRVRAAYADTKNTAESKEFCSVARPLFSQDSCFVYKAVNDIVLIACCPLPPTPSTASSTVTRIPNALPGQHVAPSNVNASIADLTSSTSSLQSDATGPRQKQPQRHDLTFSTATAMSTTWHGMIEFLTQLVTALERYLLSQGTPESGSKRSSLVSPSAGQSPSSSTKNFATPRKTLSADIVQLNSGIVYEVLDECMELGYPMMPSLAQLDLLVFGVPKLS